MWFNTARMTIRYAKKNLVALLSTVMNAFLTSVNAAIATTFQSSGKVMSLHGSVTQLNHQVCGLLFTIALAAAGTLVILKVVDALIGLRVSAEEEDAGLDPYAARRVRLQRLAFVD